MKISLIKAEDPMKIIEYLSQMKSLRENTKSQFCLKNWTE